MTQNIAPPALSSFSIQKEASDYQDKILPQVSRTFALTIPQLPPALRHVVANAYLLCRIADTIEDEPALSAEQKHHYENAFVHAVTGNIDAQRFASEVSPLLSTKTQEAEHNLLHHLPLILQITQTLKPVQRTAIIHCLKVMTGGMAEFQSKVSLHGLTTMHELNCYCYCVAGVVGEMLTKLIIDFAPELEVHRNVMLPLSVSFGFGLQLTNILKDQWEDRSRGACWLPQDIFVAHGIQLAKLRPDQQDQHYAAALTELIGIAHSHLRQALEYTLLIPKKHAGVRRFCLWSIGLAMLTLRNLYKKCGFDSGLQVKVSHKLVASTIVLTRLSSKYNQGLCWLFTIAAHNLPLTPLAAPPSDSDTYLSR